LQRSIIAPAERVTNLRWGIAVLIGIGVLITSCDKVALAVSGDVLARQLGITLIGFGYLLSSFGVAYAIAQIPFGIVLDRIGVPRTGRIWIALWSVISLLTLLASSFGLLMGVRALLGIAEAPALPAAAKATGYWFPVNERSTGTAVYDAGAKLGMAIGLPLMAALVYPTQSWRLPFIVTGIAGLLYLGAWIVFYRDPAEHPGLTYAEKQHLIKGGAQAEGPPSGVNVFAQRKAWGLAIGFAAYAFAFFLIATWLPLYFALTFKVAIFRTALAAAIPWLIAALADVFIGGMLVDRLVARSANPTRVRQIVLIAGIVLGLAVFGAATTHDESTALAYITLSLVGLGISAPVAWSIPSLIAPRGSVGTMASMMNCAGAFGAVVAPIAAGYVVNGTGSFNGVFAMTAGVLLVGILSYVFLLGRIEPIDAAESAGILI
jgi:ACS family D-galactonate transporter-like MFS transporter